MDVTEIDISIPGAGAGDPNRSPGLHLSAILKSMMAKLEPARFNTGKPMDMLRVEAGFAFERMMERGLRAKFPHYDRPGEYTRDGIAFSPDGYDSDTRTLYELKCTWMSSKDAPLDKRFWHWLVQIKAYCYVLECFSAVLVAFFVNGDYRDSGPQLRAWRLEFNARELAENFSMLTNFARAEGLLK